MAGADIGEAAGAEFAVTCLTFGCKSVQAARMRRIAVVSDYAELIACLRERADALNVSNSRSGKWLAGRLHLEVLVA
jgi:hypothetical protein